MFNANYVHIVSCRKQNIDIIHMTFPNVPTSSSTQLEVSQLACWTARFSQTDPVMYVRATKNVTPNMMYRNQLLARGCIAQKHISMWSGDDHFIWAVITLKQHQCRAGLVRCGCSLPLTWLGAPPKPRYSSRSFFFISYNSSFSESALQSNKGLIAVDLVCKGPEKHIKNREKE